MLYGAGFLLLTAIGGYWVLERAEKQKRGLKQVGQLLGAIIIVVSLIGAGCHVWGLDSGKALSYCPHAYKGKKGWSCPYHRSGSPAPTDK